MKISESTIVCASLANVAAINEFQKGNVETFLGFATLTLLIVATDMCLSPAGNR